MNLNITITTHWWELNSVHKCINDYPPGGKTIEALMTKSIIESTVYPAIARRVSKLRVNGDEKRRMRNQSWTLKNHEARALALYLTLIITGNHVVNDHDRSCIDYLRIKLTKSVA